MISLMKLKELVRIMLEHDLKEHGLGLEEYGR
jgi:hypothetical protein